MSNPACGSCTAPVSDAYLCAGCTRDLAEQLLLAASIAGDLDDAVAKLLKRGSGGPRSEAEAPLPIDLAASDVATALKSELVSWVRMVAEPSPIPGPICLVCRHGSCTRIRYGHWPQDGTADIARWLAARVGRIRQHGLAPVAHRNIRQAVHAALAVIDRQPERAPAGQCEACGRQLLAELGADEVTCGCGALTVALMAKRRERADAADVLGTPAEIVAVLKRIGIDIPRGTVTSWVSRQRIALRPGNVIALSDVLALHAQSQTRR